MNDPTPIDGVGLRHLFSRDDDDVTDAVDDVIDFQFNGDFEFSFDDLTFADNLLLDPNMDPDPNYDPVSLNLSSDIGSNSPGIGSNYDVYSGNCCDRDSCLCLLIDDDDNRSGNLINCDCDSVSRRKLIENRVINRDCDGINRNSDVIDRNSEEINRISEEIDEINRNSEEISSSGSGSDCMSKSEVDRAAEIRIGREIVSESKPDRAEENRSGSGSDCVSESKPDRVEENRSGSGSGSGSDCVSELKPDRVEEKRRGGEFVSKLRPDCVAEKRSRKVEENRRGGELVVKLRPDCVAEKRSRKVEVERDGASSENSSECVSKAKRKIEVERDDGGEIRVRKFRRAEVSESVNEESVEGGDDEKRKARLIRNRESAQLSRQRKKQYVEELEDKVRAMHSTITDLNGKISYFMSENATLRQQLSSGVAAGMPPPPPGMYPPHPMAYPWMPYPPPPAYMVKPQGSQVPLVPIPRLKPQNPVSAPKVKKSSDGKKEKERERKTKKVASVSLFGLLFFMLLFGGLMPMVSVRYGRVRDDVSGVQTGAVFTVDKHEEKVGHVDGKFGHGRVLQEFNNSTSGNNSVPLVASLYVPRNDKLVKIDGNLIIHSILSSEKAMASQKAEETKTSEETGLAIHGSYPPYPTPGPGSNKWRRPHLDRNQNGRQRALGPGSADFTPIGSDGKIQQWFREGLAEPMLSSGMCTEVFQFDVSPTPGSIVPATSVANITSEDRLNATRPNIPKNRRILPGHAIPFTDHTLNTTEEHMRSHKQNDGLESNKSRSSVVVSVLVDPREVGDGGDGEGVLGSKTLPRIFVVVLIDSVKYVTYSCMLPFMGSGSHLITA